LPGQVDHRMASRCPTAPVRVSKYLARFFACVHTTWRHWGTARNQSRKHPSRLESEAGERLQLSLWPLERESGELSLSGISLNEDICTSCCVRSFVLSENVVENAQKMLHFLHVKFHFRVRVNGCEVLTSKDVF
jgi:hypothetical protein